MTPYYEHAGITIYHGDCRDVLPSLPAVELVVADVPYHGVLDDAWDNAWRNDGDYLTWLDGVVRLVDDRLADNGTVYVFSSPRLSASVEASVSNRLSVIGSVVWDKGGARMGAAGSGIDVSALRTYWHSDSERVTLAEKRLNAAYQSADDHAKQQCGYWAACERAKRSVIGDYLRAEFQRAGVSNKEIAALFPSASGGLTGCVSNWLLGANIPTPEQYAAMRAYLNRSGDDGLRREYDDLRREYDDLRRPFLLRPSHQWGSVWRFPIERTRSHPAQKPLAMMSQIIDVSSRDGDTVLDPFMGSGTTLRAAKDMGRQAIGIEQEERYCEIAAKRLAQEVLPLELGA